jgi:hypothetical protein
MMLEERTSIRLDEEVIAGGLSAKSLPDQDERNQSRYSYSSGSLTVYAIISSDGIDERLIGLMTYPLRADIRWFNVPGFA